jgi:hypothetical protein
MPFCRVAGILMTGIPNKVAAIIDTMMKAKKVFDLRTDIRKISSAIHKRIIRKDISRTIR